MAGAEEGEDAGGLDTGAGELPELGTPPLLTGTVGAVGVVGEVGASGAAVAGVEIMFHRKYPPTPTAPSTKIVDVASFAIRGPPETNSSGKTCLV